MSAAKAGKAGKARDDGGESGDGANFGVRLGTYAKPATEGLLIRVYLRVFLGVGSIFRRSRGSLLWLDVQLSSL